MIANKLSERHIIYKKKPAGLTSSYLVSYGENIYCRNFGIGAEISVKSCQNFGIGAESKKAILVLP